MIGLFGPLLLCTPLNFFLLDITLGACFRSGDTLGHYYPTILWDMQLFPGISEPILCSILLKLLSVDAVVMARAMLHLWKSLACGKSPQDKVTFVILSPPGKPQLLLWISSDPTCWHKSELIYIGKSGR